MMTSESEVEVDRLMTGLLQHGGLSEESVTGFVAEMTAVLEAKCETRVALLKRKAQYVADMAYNKALADAVEIVMTTRAETLEHVMLTAKINRLKRVPRHAQEFKA